MSLNCSSVLSCQTTVPLRNNSRVSAPQSNGGSRQPGGPILAECAICHLAAGNDGRRLRCVRMFRTERAGGILPDIGL
jgi:hypothetical protein